MKKVLYNKFGIVGKRTNKEIQKEIDYLFQLDKDISNKVRASYSIPQKLSKSLKDIQI
jgi:hypothetical protein|tara:strand:+ start:4097 stop:4270 length:174 start_codon:yes stop_codon:yes gene_type:complete